jgi:prepilin-type N-terminal cleavage/methylation domain-containing protein
MLLPVSINRKNRLGFTLIELLAVLTIIAVLIALMSPAIQKVRETANRLACSNNLKQIGLAFIAYHDNLGALPNGGKNAADPPVTDPDPNPPTTRPYDRSEWSWPYQILPYIEQNNLYSQSDDNAIAGTPLKIYYCPTRRPPLLYNNLAKIDYAGSAGTDIVMGKDGVLVRAKTGSVRLTDIGDGTTHTLIVGEKQLNLLKLGISYDDNEACYSPGWDPEIFRVAVHAGSTWFGPLPDYRDPLSNAASYYFGSSHPVGIQAVFADGSVHTIRFGLNPALFLSMCSRNDSQTSFPDE